MTTSPVIQGKVAPGFERVGRVFEHNLVERGERRAAVAAYVEGRPVVELTGTAAGLPGSVPWPEDEERPFPLWRWRISSAAAVALSRGLLGLDRTVAEYWPHFARHGKHRITVRQVLAHRTGILPSIRVKLEARTRGGSVAGALEEARPAWEPGTRQAHDDLTMLGITTELLGRTDPYRRKLQRFVTEEVARPLGLSLSAADDSDAVGGAAAQQMSAGGGGAEVNGVAKAFGDLATGGDRLGISRDVFAEIVAPPPPPSKGWGDAVLGVDLRCSLGFLKASPSFPFGSSDRAFGIAGAGGAFAFADPDLGLGFCYAGDREGPALPGDARERSLRNAVLRCLGGQPRHPIEPGTEGGTDADGR